MSNKPTNHLVPRALKLLLVIGVVLLAVPPGAFAHFAHPRFFGDFRRAYSFGVFPPAREQVHWWFESGFPGGRNGPSSYKSAVLRGPLAWNGLARRLVFVSHGNREIPYGPPYTAVRGTGDGRTTYCDATRDDPATPQDDRRPLSLVFWESIPSDPGFITLGEATTCADRNDTAPRSFFVAFNRDHGSRWYRGAAFDVPGEPNTADAKSDLQAAATHEFGHAGGWYPHYDDPRPENTEPFPNASCGVLNPRRETMCALDTSGAAWWRTLGEHDRHTFRRGYP